MKIKVQYISSEHFVFVRTRKWYDKWKEWMNDKPF